MTEGWRTIESAPKDGRPLIGFFPYQSDFPAGGSVFVMRWHDERYRPNPRPHFLAAGWTGGLRDQRVRQPTHWMPLPAAPAQAHAANTIVDAFVAELAEKATPESIATGAALLAERQALAGCLAHNDLGGRCQNCGRPAFAGEGGGE